MTNIPTPDVVALVRRRYRDGAAVKSICAESGIGNYDVIYRCLDGDYPDGSSAKPPSIPRRRKNLRRRVANRAALVSRMWCVAERQVEEIDERLQASGLEIAERESGARTLAILAKTLRELSVLDQARRNPCGKKAEKDDDADAVPRDVEDLRRALADKLETFIAERSDSVSGEAE